MGSVSTTESSRLAPIPIASPSETSSYLDNIGPSDNIIIEDSSHLPIVFRWPTNGVPPERVNIRVWADDFSFSKTVPLYRSKSEPDFVTILHLPKGLYNYEFEVDGEWRYARDQPSTTDGNRIVNTIALDLPEMEIKYSNSSPPGEYSTNIKKDITLLGTPPIKGPSTLPPHLNRALLNCRPLTGTNGDTLPLPHHVMINHVYSRPSSHENTLIFGLTTRYKTKFVTTVFFISENQNHLNNNFSK